MNVSRAVDYWVEYHKSHSKKNTIPTYGSTISKFRGRFGDREPKSLSPDDVLSFLSAISAGERQLTKRTRYSHLKTCFNFIKNTLDQGFQNPCDTPMLRKLFKGGETVRWKILEKEVVDEIIFRTTNPRNRLILELMARGGMRISEVTLGLCDFERSRLRLRRTLKSKGGTYQSAITSKF